MSVNFHSYPFERLKLLVAPITPYKQGISLSIGEPQFETPLFIQDALKNSSSELRYYPKSAGENYLIAAQIDFVKNRFNAMLKPTQIIPTFGTREALFNLPQYLLFNISSPVLAYPNPFYQIYEGAAIASRAEVIHMNLQKKNNFKPILTQQERKRANLVILNSPNNPTGATLCLDELKTWIEWAIEDDFILLNDECYSEIYQETPPAGILEACIALGNMDFKNVLALNSISKRSCAPGLRSGFVGGDETILKGYKDYRTYLGCSIPNPLQKAAAVAWQDTYHSDITRKKYAKNLQIAKVLFPDIAPYTFYLWLEVGDDIDFTKKLYEQEGILVVPGSFLGRNGVGSGYVRVALVHEEDILAPALKTLADFWHSYKTLSYHFEKGRQCLKQR